MADEKRPEKGRVSAAGDGVVSPGFPSNADADSTLGRVKLAVSTSPPVLLLPLRPLPALRDVTAVAIVAVVAAEKLRVATGISAGRCAELEAADSPRVRPSEAPC
jgi:hypothetical protein